MPRSFAVTALSLTKIPSQYHYNINLLWIEVHSTTSVGCSPVALSILKITLVGKMYKSFL